MVALMLALLVFLAVAFVVVSALEVPARRQELLREQIAEYDSGGAGLGGVALEVLRTTRAGAMPTLDKVMAGTSLSERISLDMVRADLRLQPGEYIAIHIATAAIGLILIDMVAGSFLLGLAAVPLSYLAIRFYVKHRQESIMKAFESQLPDAIEMVNSSLKAGFGLLQGLEYAAKELPKPMSGEFTQVVRDMGVGMDLDEALAGMARRVPSRDVFLFVTAVIVHRSVGGNLAEVLGGIAGTVRARLRLRDEVHALTTTPRMSGYVLAALPVGAFLMISLTNPQYVSLLLGTDLGRMMLAGAAGMVTFGLFVMNRLTKLDY